MHEALSRDEEFTTKGAWLRSWDGVSKFGTPFIPSEPLKLEIAYLVQHALGIVWQITVENLVSEMTFDGDVKPYTLTH